MNQSHTHTEKKQEGEFCEIEVGSHMQLRRSHRRNELFCLLSSSSSSSSSSFNFIIIIIVVVVATHKKTVCVSFRSNVRGVREMIMNGFVENFYFEI